MRIKGGQQKRVFASQGSRTHVMPYKAPLYLALCYERPPDQYLVHDSSNGNVYLFHSVVIGFGKAR